MIIETGKVCQMGFALCYALPTGFMLVMFLLAMATWRTVIVPILAVAVAVLWASLMFGIRIDF